LAGEKLWGSCATRIRSDRDAGRSSGKGVVVRSGRRTLLLGLGRSDCGLTSREPFLGRTRRGGAEKLSMKDWGISDKGRMAQNSRGWVGGQNDARRWYVPEARGGVA